MMMRIVLLFLLCLLPLSASNIMYLPITGDADSGISSSNVYTHAIDFGNDSPRAVINGVTFQSSFNAIADTSALIGTGTTSIPNSHNGNNNANAFLDGASFANMEDLVNDMLFGDATAVIQLTGLTSGTNYQFKLYNRAWGDSSGNRGQDIGFDIDGVGSSIADAEDTAFFLEDDATIGDPGFATYSQVYALTYNYVLAENVTTLTVYINSTDVGTYHLYGLTNEKIEGPLSIGSFYPSDNTQFFSNLSDNLVLSFDDDIQAGSGNVVIYNSDDTVFERLDITSSQVNIESNQLNINPDQDLIVNSDYYVLLDDGAIEDGLGVVYQGISDNTIWNFSTDNDLIFNPINGDTDSGIDPKELYTHAIDFGGGTTAVVNEVTFQSGFGDPTGSSATIGTGSMSMPSTASNSNADIYLDGGASAEIEDLFNDLRYNDSTAEIILTGLTPGVNYQFRLYHRVWGSTPGIRSQDIGFETNGVGTTISDAELSFSFYEDDARQPEPTFDDWHQVYALTYNYRLSAGVTQLKIYINGTSGQTYHLYGLVNQQLQVPGTIIKLD